MAQNQPPAAPSEPGASHDPPVPLLTIYMLFFQIGALSFGGGVTAWLYRETVVKRKLLREEDFLSALTLSQVLPGINMANLSVYIGQRLRGAGGATMAMVGLITVPFFAIILFGSVYWYIKAAAVLQDFLTGMATAVVGMLLSMAVLAVRATKMQVVHLVILGLVVAAVGILRWPMIPVIVVLAPISVALAWPRHASENGQRDA